MIRAQRQIGSAKQKAIVNQLSLGRVVCMYKFSPAALINTLNAERERVLILHNALSIIK